MFIIFVEPVAETLIDYSRAFGPDKTMLSAGSTMSVELLTAGKHRGCSRCSQMPPL